jgi:uncharacterized protein
MMEFDWDPAKSKRNLKIHGVSFNEAKTVFYDDFARQFYDEGHSGEEDRFLLLGVSNTSRILLICHCEIESKDVIRIISARKATAKERQLYDGPTL